LWCRPAEPGCGWKYDGWLSALADDADIDGARLGRAICDTYYEGCEELGADGSVTLSVIDLSRTENLKGIIALLSYAGFGAFVDDPSRFYANFARGAGNADSYSHGMVDLSSLVSANKKLFPDLADFFVETINDMVVYQVKGPYRKNTNGISVFYPSPNNAGAYGAYGEAAKSGGMSWMTPQITMETNMQGGLLKGLGRMFAGESLFMATYTAASPGQSITLGSSFPGHIMALDLSGGKSYICQKNAFLAAQPTVTLAAVVPNGLKAGLFGGEGFVMQKVSGSGLVFLELDGSIKEIDLGAGEKMIVDTGSVAAYEERVTYSAEMVKGFKNILFGGEGLFLTTLTGPGKIFLQTMTTPTLAGRLIPFLPKKE
jgi:uncharacterized protein (TIGR00266 family)